MELFGLRKLRGLSKQQLPLTGFGEIIYAVGDIHGRYDLLRELVRKISEDFETQKRRQSFPMTGNLVFLGDYIDRGSDSFEVIEYLLKLEIESFTIDCLKGNHEQILLNVLENPTAFREWLKHGGAETVQSYGVTADPEMSDTELESRRLLFRAAIPSIHLKFLRDLRLNLHRSPLFFVHAGVDPKKPLEAQDEQSCLWIREEFLGSRKKLPSIIVHGHTPQALPSWDGRRIGVDTGAYFTNKLVCAKIYGNDVEFIST